MPSAMSRLGVRFVALAALALTASLGAREIWIRQKIDALTAPPSQRHASANAALSPKGALLRVVMIGDSSVSRWPTQLLGDRFEFINRGVGGETTAQIARRFDQDAIALHPDVILIAAGANDLVAASFLDEQNAEEVAAHTVATLLELVQKSVDAGAQAFLATLAPPGCPELARLPVWKPGVRVLFQRTNAELRAARLPQHATLVDFARALGGDDLQSPQEFHVDTLHLNTEGYKRLSSATRDRLSTTYK
jgi:lysophospholipase L1-like esterase